MLFFVQDRGRLLWLWGIGLLGWQEVEESLHPSQLPPDPSQSTILSLRLKHKQKAVKQHKLKEAKRKSNIKKPRDAHKHCATRIG